jgi:hypothetical protein
MIGLEQIYISLGFESAQEYNRLIGSLELETPGQLAAFKKWDAEDGTKEGLEKLINDQINSIRS